MLAYKQFPKQPNISGIVCIYSAISDLPVPLLSLRKHDAESFIGLHGVIVRHNGNVHLVGSSIQQFVDIGETDDIRILHRTRNRKALQSHALETGGGKKRRSTCVFRNQPRLFLLVPCV